MFLNFHPIMRLDYHLEQICRAPQQLQLGISQLLELFFLQLNQTGLKQFLLIVLMSQLHQHKDIVVLGLVYHVFSEQFDQGLDLEEFDDRVVFQDLGSGDFDGETVETFHDVCEVVDL